jgi:hypothetical protein
MPGKGTNSPRTPLQEEQTHHRVLRIITRTLMVRTTTRMTMDLPIILRHLELVLILLLRTGLVLHLTARERCYTTNKIIINEKHLGIY